MVNEIVPQMTSLVSPGMMMPFSALEAKRKFIVQPSQFWPEELT